MLLTIPIKTQRPRIRPSYLTITIMVICTLVQITGDLVEPIQRTVSGFGMSETIEMSAPIALFALWPSEPFSIGLITHQFVHGGWMHLIGNMLFLWIFGSLVEDAIRPWGMAAVYLGGGLCAAATHLFMTSVMGFGGNIPMVGASGAIAGILGLAMLRFYKTKVEIFYCVFLGFRVKAGVFAVDAVWALALWFVMELFPALLSDGGGGVAHWAHVGGFVAGIVAAPFLGSLADAKKEYFTDDAFTNVEYLRRSEEADEAARALKADPTNGYKMWKVAQAYREAGEFERASNMYQRCLNRFLDLNFLEQATEVYKELREYDTTFALPAERLLRMARHLEYHAPIDAVPAYQTLGEKHGDTIEGEYACLRLAWMYLHGFRQPFEAAKYFDWFLQRYPTSVWASRATQERVRLDQQLRLR